MHSYHGNHCHHVDSTLKAIAALYCRKCESVVVTVVVNWNYEKEPRVDFIVAGCVTTVVHQMLQG